MDLLHRNPRDVGPSLVSVSVVVQELVAEHEGHGQEPVLAARTALHGRIHLLEPADIQKGQDGHIEGHLSGR